MKAKVIKAQILEESQTHTTRIKMMMATREICTDSKEQI